MNSDSSFDQAYQMARGLDEAGRADEAEQLYRILLRQRPTDGEIRFRLARVLAQQGKVADAEAELTQLLTLMPDFALAHFHRANLLAAATRYAEAEESFRDAVAHQPDLLEAWVNLGNVLQILKRSEEALEVFDEVISREDGMAPIWFNRGNALSDLNRHEEAIASFDRALTLDPSLAQALNNKGAALERLGRHEEAIACYGEALAIRPHHGTTYRNLGAALFEARRFEEAVEAYETALRLDPDQDYLLGALIGAKASLCAWNSHDTDVAAAVDGVRGGKPVIHPFIFLGVWDRPEDQYGCARTWVRDRYPPASHPLWRGERYEHDRIRIAYVSADFHDHPMAYLLSGVFECHDRSRFETFAVSLGRPSDGPQRRRFEAAFEHFVDVREKSDTDIARLLHQWEIDIAIDRKGFTRGARPAIFANRPAPLQVSYVAYTGTMAAPYIDYLIADETVIPEADHRHYSEQIVDLPGCYLPNDDKRPISRSVPSRAQAGLPEGAFVFSAFVNPWKITPDIFDVWMAVLRAVEPSVLWLIEHSAATSANLRREAESRGVAGDRLIFARHIDNPEHLARHTLADLSLDTLPYGSHTTASDSLWAGVPILTCLGRSFAGRVTASMLKSIGLADLITRDLDEYQAAAARLAQDRDALAALRQRLAENLATHPLFDTALYCRHLETAYEAMWRRHLDGQAPRGFKVPNLAQ